MPHMLFEDINSVLSEEYLEEKADVKAMIADFDQDSLSNAIHNAIKELDPEANVGGNLDAVTSKVVSVLQQEAPRIQNNFQREDRVVWAIKFLKFHLLCTVGSTTGTWYKGKRFTPDQMSVELFKNVFSKMNFMKKLQKTQGRDSVEQEYTAFATRGTYIPLRAQEMLGNLLRYLETEIKPILDFVWDPKLTYTYLKRELEDIYEDYKVDLEGWTLVDEEAGDKIIIAYKSEKMYWFDLQREICRSEADAAGHCGNEPGDGSRVGSGDNIYSLSSLKKVGNDWYRYPHVTAILERDGYIGEIKGRQNKAPIPKYGEKLVDLFLLPSVVGIGRARWVEDSNWTWDDFTEEQQQRILAEKDEFDATGEHRDESEVHGSVSAAANWLNGDGDADAMEEWLDEHVYLNYNSITKVTNDTISIEFNTDVSDVYRVLEDDIFAYFGELITEHTAQDGEELDDAGTDPVDFAREACLFLSGNASVRAAVQSFKNEFKDNIQYGEWLRRHYANLRGSDKALDKLIDTKFGTILNQKEFDFIEDSEATRAAWAKVVKEAKAFDIFDNELFENLLVNASRAVYSAMMESAYTPGDSEWPKFERKDDIPFAYDNIKSNFYTSDFDEYGFDDDEYRHLFASTLDQSLEDNVAQYDFTVNGAYENYIIDLWEYCFGTENERYMDRRLSSRDPETVDEYKKKEYARAIYKALSGKEHPIKRS
jgi:hypothetical protein